MFSCDLVGQLRLQVSIVDDWLPSSPANGADSAAATLPSSVLGLLEWLPLHRLLEKRPNPLFQLDISKYLLNCECRITYIHNVAAICAGSVPA